jgi:hypothetical protein
MASDEIYVSRVEREFKAFWMVFRRNRILGIAIVLIALGYGLHLGGFPPTGKPQTHDDLMAEILRQAREYQRLSGEYRRINEQLTQTQDAANRARIQQLEEQLKQTNAKIEDRAEKLVADPRSYGGVKLAPAPVLEAWRKCVETGGGQAETACNEILRSGFSDVSR